MNLEERIQQIGQDLFTRMKGEKPGLFNKAWWSGQMLDWSMRDEDFKTEMFRFVDVFPVLRSPEEIARHIQEYLLRPGLKVPAAIKVALKGAGLGGMATRMAAGQIAKNLEGMAKTFIAGVNADTAIGSLDKLRKTRQAFTVDLLGEATVSEAEAEEYAARYRDLIEGLAKQTASWPHDELLDEDDRGPIPRVNVSVKVSAMYSQLDPIDPEGSIEAAAQRLIPLCEAAMRAGVFLNFDMEQHRYKDLTLALFKRVLEDDRLAAYEDAGIAMQAYLRDAEQDVRALIKWAKKKKKRVTVRLVKGAYWDYETVLAEQEGWPSPVWLDKAASDACFESCIELLLGNHKYVRTAIGSHNVRSLAHAIATAERNKVPINGYEIQCLYGMAEPIKAACVARGHRLRVYAPVGELIPGMAYLVRRLLENTSNEGWLRMGFADDVPLDRLLARPQATPRSAMLREVPPAKTSVDAPVAFVNEPLRDFSCAEQRLAFQKAAAEVDKNLGKRYPVVVEGESVATERTLDSVDPSDGSTVIGTVDVADVALADRAVASAAAAFPVWRDTPVSKRVEVLFQLAAQMRKQRDSLAALMVRESGKTWREADADVAEAIDFCEYYGREMLRLAVPRLMQRLPGELNHLSYLPRGVALVIAPWNFPLAILSGMMAAALVGGNTVLLKPAEQSPVIAAKLMNMLQKCGLPRGVVQFLPGYGEEIGAHLVAHPQVATIAFTGSMEVGLQIYKQAGITVPGQASLKRVICEMGGKNAIIVDSDADLDEAVLGVVHSAFGFSGQKCSACSRVIVLRDNYKDFVRRLVEATRSLVVGPANRPSTAMGPVIDVEAQERIAAAISSARERLNMAVGGSYAGPGSFVMPTIFTDVSPDDPIAQNELFGPVLAVIPADDFDQALKIALGTPYALTGGIYSRSPVHIQKARETFRVGNLYINRSTTGAVVGRQPFGGFKMSGGGTKAGGPDYLLQFLDPRTITENTLRRGFAPADA